MSFPNTKSVAYFEHRSQLIFLKEIRADYIEQDFKTGNPSQIRKNLSTIYHEITHWADTVGTIWGNDHLKLVYSAYDVMPQINTERGRSEFYKFLDLHDQDRRLSFADYYRTVLDNGSKHTTETPWKIGFSCGVEFNYTGRPDETRPVIFVKFSDHYSDQPLVRQPLSVAALLETTATWSELSTQFQIIGRLKGDNKLTEEAIIKREYSKNLYSPELTLYSAPVHLLAHYTKLKNSFVAYNLAAMISLICLNLVGSHFRKMKIPDDLDAWSNRIPAFKSSQSRPFAFLCISINAPLWTEETSPIDWVNTALSNSNLPSYKEILQHAIKTLTEDHSSCVRPELAPRQRYLRKLGVEWLTWRQEEQNAAIDCRHLNAPELTTPVMFGADDAPFVLFNSNFDTKVFDPIRSYNDDAELHTQILNFTKACR